MYRLGAQSVVPKAILSSATSDRYKACNFCCNIYKYNNFSPSGGLHNCKGIQLFLGLKRIQFTPSLSLIQSSPSPSLYLKSQPMRSPAPPVTLTDLSVCLWLISPRDESPSRWRRRRGSDQPRRLAVKTATVMKDYACNRNVGEASSDGELGFKVQQARSGDGNLSPRHHRTLRVTTTNGLIGGHQCCNSQVPRLVDDGAYAVTKQWLNNRR